MLSYKQCTLKPPSCCSRSKEENQQQVWEFMEKKGRNDSWIACHYNRFNHTQVIATKGNYQLAIFTSLFWPLLAVTIGFSLIRYVKNLQPGNGKKKISTEDRRRVVVLSTLPAFLRSEGQPVVSDSQSHSYV